MGITRNGGRDLTIKEMGFVRDLVKMKNITKACKKNYNTKSNRNASLIGQQIMHRPRVQYAILDLMDRKGMSDLKLTEKLQNMIFESRKEVLTKDGEIVKLVDNQAQLKALDMAMKIKGAYAPERHENTNINVNIYQDLSDAELSERIKLVEAREATFIEGEGAEVGA
jgi:hypothetical protein